MSKGKVLVMGSKATRIGPGSCTDSDHQGGLESQAIPFHGHHERQADTADLAAGIRKVGQNHNHRNRGHTVMLSHPSEVTAFIGTAASAK